MSGFFRSLSSEWRKILSTKLWWIFAIVLAGYSAMMAALFAFIFSAMGEAMGIASGAAGAPLLPKQQTADLIYSSVTTFGYVIPLLLGALMVTGEIRHRTLALTFTIEPRRNIVLASKTVVLLGFGVILAVAGLIGAIGAGAPVLNATGGDAMLNTPETWALFGRIIVAISVWAVIGLGVGLLVGNQAFAIVIALVFTQFLEPVMRSAAQFWEWSAQVAKFLPGSASDAFVGASVLSDLAALDPTAPAAAGGGALSIWAGLLVLLAYAVVAILAGWALRWRRDVV